MYSTHSMTGGGGSSNPPRPPRPPERPPEPGPTPEPPERPVQSQETTQVINDFPSGIVVAIGAEALRLGVAIEIRVIKPTKQ